MRKLLLIISSVAMAYCVGAQENETSKQKEIGLALRSFEEFGLTYKFGHTNAMWRLNTLVLSGNSGEREQDSIVRKSTAIGATLNFGREFRKNIFNDFELRLGADLGVGFRKFSTSTDDQSIDDSDYMQSILSFSPSLRMIIGFNYIIKEKIVIGAELLPGVSYSIQSREYERPFDNVEQGKSYDWNYGLSNSSALLTFALRF